MKIGIIGHGSDKFTQQGKAEAIQMIRDILIKQDNPILVSGHSPVGGIDIWSEEVADSLGIAKDIKTPRQHKWDAEYGFKQRNLDIARDSDELYVILVAKYPPDYKGRVFSGCYHCHSSDHIKSGACWTAKHHQRIKGLDPIYRIIEND